MRHPPSTEIQTIIIREEIRIIGSEKNWGFVNDLSKHFRVLVFVGCKALVRSMEIENNKINIFRLKMEEKLRTSIGLLMRTKKIN